MPRSTALGLLVLATVFTLTGCGGKRDTAATQGLVVSLGIGEPKFLIPSSATESNASDVLNALFTPLIDWVALDSLAAGTGTTNPTEITTGREALPGHVNQHGCLLQ